MSFFNCRFSPHPTWRAELRRCLLEFRQLVSRQHAWKAAQSQGHCARKVVEPQMASEHSQLTRAKGGWSMSDVNDACVLSESGLSFNLFQPSVHRQASLQSLVHLFFLEPRLTRAVPPKELSRGSGIFISGDAAAQCLPIAIIGRLKVELRNWKRRHQMSRNRTLENNSHLNSLEAPPRRKKIIT